MNGKRAKYIRSMARDVSQGLPEVKYNSYSPPYFNKDGVKVSPGVPRTLNKNCTRWMYQNLK